MSVINEIEVELSRVFSLVYKRLYLTVSCHYLMISFSCFPFSPFSLPPPLFPFRFEALISLPSLCLSLSLSILAKPSQIK